MSKFSLQPLTYSIKKSLAIGGVAFVSSVVWADNSVPLHDSVHPNDIWLDYGEVQQVCASDFDQDGDLDLFEIYPDVMTRLDNEGTAEIPDFSSPRILMMNAPDDSKLHDMGIVNCSHSTNNHSAERQLIDIDGDGDFDLFSVASSGKYGSLSSLSINEGSNEKPEYTDKDPKDVGLPSDAGSLLFVDIDMDGDLDFFSNIGEVFYENQGTSKAAQFVKQESTSIKANCSHQGEQFIKEHALLVDLNNDGRLDRFCRSTKDEAMTYFEASTEGYVATQLFNSPPTLARLLGLQSFDIDMDGDIDILSHRANFSVLYTNIAEGLTPQFDTGKLYTTFPETLHSSAVTFVDVDGDDDLDYLFKLDQSNTLGLATNIGSTIAPQYSINNTPSEWAQCNLGFERLGPNTVSSTALADSDNDGDNDFFAAVLFYDLPGLLMNRIVYCENKGTSTHPVYGALLLSEFGFSSDVMSGLTSSNSLIFEDRDGDGDQDLWAYPYIFDNVGDINNPWFTLSSERPYDMQSQFFLPVDMDNDGLSESVLASHFRNKKVYSPVERDGVHLLYQGLNPVQHVATSYRDGYDRDPLATQHDSFIKVSQCGTRYGCNSIVFPEKSQELSIASIGKDSTVLAIIDRAGDLNVKSFSSTLGLKKEKKGGKAHSISMAGGLGDGGNNGLITFVDESENVNAVVFDRDLSIVSVVQLGQGKQPQVSFGHFFGKPGYVVSYLTVDNQLKIANVLVDGTLIGQVDGGAAIDVKVSRVSLLLNTPEDDYIVSIIQPDGKIALLGFTGQGVLLGKVVGNTAQQPTAVISVGHDKEALAVAMIQSDKKPAVIFLDNQGHYIATGVAEKSAISVDVEPWGDGARLIYLDDEGVIRYEKFNLKGERVK